MIQKFPFVFIVIFVTVFLAGSIAGFIGGRLGGMRELPSNPAVNTQDMRGALPGVLVDSPVVGNWEVQVQGKLVKKTQDSITLEQNGITLVIPIAPVSVQTPSSRASSQKAQSRVTRFIIADSPGGKSEPHYLSLDEVPIGAQLYGRIFIEEDQSFFGQVFAISPETSE